MAKAKLAVLMGGPSREHDVSLKSGRAILDSIDQKKYQPVKVVISLSGEWSIEDSEPMSAGEAVDMLRSQGVDHVFIALHGSFGEDGKVQALLSKSNLNYTGSGVEASLLAMDKILSAELFRSTGLTVPRSVAASRYELIQMPEIFDAIKKLSPKLIVKPATQGSSVGVSLVESSDDLVRAVDFALEHDNQVIIQEFIEGREVSCGVLEYGKAGLTALPPTELIPNGADFFDFYAKYTKGATNEITPPDMPPKVIKSIQDTAVQAHKLLGCSGYSRTDMIVTGEKIHVIEINTLPGMTETSILPQQAAKQNITMTELIDIIIDASKLKQEL